MSLHHNPKIVTDGLVLAYDMDNVAKSFKGKPTTNLTTNTPTQAGWQGNYSLVSSDTKTFDVTTQQNNSSTTSAWRTWYWDVSSYEGSTITISGDVQFLEANDAEFLHITIGQGNTGSFPVHIAGSSAADKVQISTRPDQKIHMTWTGTINSAGLVGFTQWINNVTADGGNSTLRISNIQIEVSGFETPFVNGTRSNTQALLDMSKSKNTITTTSLTYNSDGTFEFEGAGGVGAAGDYLSCGNSSDVNFGTGNFTLSFFANRTATGYQGGSYVSKGNGTSLGFDFRDNNFYVHGSSGLISSMGFNPSQNSMNHHTFVFDRSSSPYINYYLNGEYSFSSTTNNSANIGSSIDTTRDLDICRSQAGGVNRYFNGTMPIVKLYNRALTAAEIKQNFNATRGRFGI